MSTDSVNNPHNIKSNLEKQFYNIHSEYSRKWIKKMYTRVYEDTSDFRKELLSIIDWDIRKKNKETKRYLNHIYKHFDLDEEEVLNMFNTILVLMVKCAKINTSTTCTVTLETSAQNILLRILKTVCRTFYDDKHLILCDKNVTNIKIIESLNYMLYKYLPLSVICESESELIEDVAYNFEEQIQEHESNEIIVHKQNSSTIDTATLRYIGSDEFKNDYYEESKESSEEEQPKQVFLKKSQRYITS